MDKVRAHFITWTTYGTRLHGDERGSVDRNHNTYDTPYLAPNLARQKVEERALRWPPYVMSGDARLVIERAIRDHSTHKGWAMLSLNVRTNHVHAVVVADAVHPDLVMEQFKSWGTRRLRQARLVEGPRAVWTEHGSTRWLWSDDDIFDACRYVEELQ